MYNELRTAFDEAMAITLKTNSEFVLRDKENINLTNIKISELAVTINPQTMMMINSPKEAIDFLDSKGLRNFFLRLTSRFYFLISSQKIHLERYYEWVYESCNIFEPIISNAGRLSSAANLLGDENKERCMSFSDFKMLIMRNRWYFTLCLFSLVGVSL